MVQKERHSPAPGQAPRPRGRPRGFDPDVALGSARSAFWNTGFAATSLDELSDATGLNRPSLYGAFGDKRALYLKSLERSRDETLAALEGALAPGLPLRAALSRVYGRAIDIYLAGDAGPRGCFIISTAVVEAVADETVRATLLDALTGIDAAFEARLAAAVADGELPPGADPKGLALLAAAVLNNLAIRARAGFERGAMEAAAKAGVEAICGPAAA